MDYQLITYFFLNVLILFIFAKISYKFKLLDIPSKRKIHSIATAYTGGIAISLILLISLLLFELKIDTISLIISMAFLISIIGLIDDKFDLNVGNKLSLQIIPIFYLIIFEGLSINHLGDYHYFKLNLEVFSIPFTLMCVLFLINAFNYFDGMDGTLSFTSISVLAILYFLIPEKQIQLYLLIISMPIFVFLFFNFKMFKLPKLFLGDSGSLLLGFIIAYILIYIANKNLVHPILLAWCIVIFVYEFISINLIRIINKQNPFKAGKDHLHHNLFEKTDSIIITNFLMVASNIILFFIGYFSFIIVGQISSIVIFILLFFVFFFVRKKYL